MPIPKPKDGESKDKFMPRCMGNPTMVREFPDSSQRAAVCSSAYDKKQSEASPDKDWLLREWLTRQINKLLK